jgi:single-strand DNA-binding protein
LNVITLTGNATKDIELSYSPQGTAFGKGTIAVQRNFKNQEGNYDTDFINFKTIGKISEVMANYVKKGDKFGVTGSLQIDRVEKDGIVDYYTNVFVNGFDFPVKRDNAQPGPSNLEYKNDDPFSGEGKTIDVTDDDLPF